MQQFQSVNEIIMDKEIDLQWLHLLSEILRLYR